MLGKIGHACLVALTDRKSRFLLSAKLRKKRSEELADKMIALLSVMPAGCVRSITPDRGNEFQKHERITTALGGVPFYFADPHTPWQKGTVENTNGLLREYFPKSFDFDACSEREEETIPNFV